MHRRKVLKAAASAAALGAMRIVAAKGPPPGELARDDVVRLLIVTDRERLLERLVAEIRAGLDYPTLLGAIAEAAAREVRPYPQVGFKYHAFMVLHAVHRNTLHGRVEDRWLPVLWSADVLKASQAEERRMGAEALGPVAEHLIPPPGGAERAFEGAMARWDAEAADVAIVGLLRTLPRDRLFELLFRYGARDFRAIGHKAVTVANCHRLLGVVSARHAEPMLRSLVLALTNHRGEPNPAYSDLAADRPWRRHLALADAMRNPPERVDSRGDDPVADMLEVLREGTDEDASRAVLAHLARGVAEQDLWTSIFAAAGDLMLKQSGIISVHAHTSANALHYAYRHVREARTRRLILLQAAAFVPLFRDLLGGDRRSLRIETLGASESSDRAGEALDDIFATISVDRVEAARKTLGYLSSEGAELPFANRARHYVVEQNVGYHDYKFAEAAFENAKAMRSPWRERYLASSVLYFNGSADEPNATVRRARALLG